MEGFSGMIVGWAMLFALVTICGALSRIEKLLEQQNEQLSCDCYDDHDGDSQDSEEKH